MRNPKEPSYPAIRLAGIRAYAYDMYTRGYLEGMPFSVYDYSGAKVFSGATNCSGFVDFFEVSPGWYRVVAGADQDSYETPTPPTTPARATGPTGYYTPGETWVPVYPGYLVAINFYLDSSAYYPQVTATPNPNATVTETPGPATSTPTASPTPTATVTEIPGPPPPPPPP